MLLWKPFHLVTVGKMYRGRVANVVAFGLFVDLEEFGLDGLLLFAETPYPEAARKYTVDDDIYVVVTKVDVQRYKIQVALPVEPQGDGWRWHDPARRIDPDWLQWNGGAVRGLARKIRAEGALDLLPVLADALVEAGCADEEILSCCRQGEGRERWVIELVLGME
jgi:hypothetical protein